MLNKIFTNSEELNHVVFTALTIQFLQTVYQKDNYNYVTLILGPVFQE